MENRHEIQAAEQLLRQEGLLATPSGATVSFTGLSNNSQETAAGDLFICKGYGFKPSYLQMAAERGAVCYLSEEAVAGARIPFLRVTDVRKAQSVLARWFYGVPSSGFVLTGITGTKGKTTTAFDLQAILSAYTGRPTGLISTVERFVGDEHQPSHLTTPESLDLQQLFARARDNGLPYVTMEVSSQAYKVDRVYGQYFDFGIFLNFGEDHVSPREHPTVEDYLACKLRLMENCGTAVICRETACFDRIYATAVQHAQKVCLVGIERNDCDYIARNVSKETFGFSFQVQEKNSAETFTYHLPQEGRFNVENALTAIAVGRELGIPHAVMALALERLQVPGRMNMITGGGLRVLVDYVHNRLSFQAVFDSLKKDYPGAPLYVVAGAPGERAEARRDDIGSLCGANAARVIFTSDDPGFDDPAAICQRMSRAAAQSGGARVDIVIDRTQAVEQIIREAPDGAVVILAGKGHEVTQRVRGQYEPYASDAVVARRALAAREAAQK